MKLQIKCAYCDHMNQFVITDLVVKHRSTELAPVKCTRCKSRFSIEISTKRKGKGDAIKTTEASAKAAHDAKVAQAVEAIRAHALKLLAEPGCMCAQLAGRNSRNAIDDTHIVGDHRVKLGGLWPGGVTNGIPQLPKHRYGCPRNPEI